MNYCIATDNLLYNPSTGRITALLDYDFACINHLAHEFFSSFATNGGQLSGWSPDSEAAEFRQSKLTGRFPSPLPVSSDVDWELAQAWEEQLCKANVKRPSTIRGVEKIADVEKLLSLLLPWRLTNEDALRRNPNEEKRKALKRASEQEIVEFLAHLGFEECSGRSKGM